MNSKRTCSEFCIIGHVLRGGRPCIYMKRSDVRKSAGEGGHLEYFRVDFATSRHTEDIAFTILSFIYHMILSNIVLKSLEKWMFSYISYMSSTHSNANLSLNSLHWLDISLINLLHSAPLKFRAINNSSFDDQTTHLLIHGKSMEISSRIWFIALSLATNSNTISYEKYRSDSFFNDVVAKA